MDTSSKWLQKYDQTPPRARWLTFASVILAGRSMSKLSEFFRKYRQYIGTEVLMYGTFIVLLALLVLFFG
ncbi:hypothetical protein GCM10027345_09090 [Hymenobacter daeguensis]